MKIVRTFALLSLFQCSLACAADDVFAQAQQTGALDLTRVFAASPLIYSLLVVLSIASVSIWLYTFITLKLKDMMPDAFTHQVRQLLSERQFDSALALCHESRNFCSSIIASGISARRHGPQVMMDVVQAEGRRQGNSLWQRIALLNEVAVIAPMLGLLGTVMGIFMGFYDSGNSPDSLASIFDGFGIAVGTTVAGLIVAILAMIFYATLKYRVLNVLNTVENEAVAIINLVDQELDTP
ncbi:MAG: MotA/TolQ/ExbB proton channel family protein [Chlamydiales bacterium]|nr:MotA/TolQ/ExbB proton channel family protein [Chlamydiales bacterium]